MKKRIASIVLSLVMLLSLLPTAALAGADPVYIQATPGGGLISTGEGNPMPGASSGWYEGEDSDGDITCSISAGDNVCSILTLSYLNTNKQENVTEVYTAIPQKGFTFVNWTYAYWDDDADEEKTETVDDGDVITQQTIKAKIGPITANFVHKHDDGTEFQPWAKGNKLPKEPGNYVLTTDVTLSETWTVQTGTTNLCLNGHVIKYQSETNGSVIKVPANATLNLYDCDTTTVHKFTDSDTTTGLWVWDDTLEGDNIKHTVTGGVITGGTGTQWGGGTDGGGVYVYVDGTFTMNGGNIVGNSVTRTETKTTDGLGGGVYVGKKFTMTGGRICGNYAGHDGGGVSINSSGIFTMTGGAITDNTARLGGGIQNNRNGSGGFGELWLTADEGKTITITGNRATTAEGGVANWSKMHLSGKVIIKDNICEKKYGDVNYPRNLATDSPITIDGALTGSEIYVTHASGYTDEHDTGVLTSGFTAKNEGAKLGDFFHYDGPSTYYMDLNEDGDNVGELEVKAVPDNKYVISIPFFEGGVVTADKQIAAKDETVTLTVKPDAGYQLKEGTLKANGGVVTITDNTFKMPEGAVTVTAEFEKKAYPIWIGGMYDGIQVTEGDVLGDGTVIYTPDLQNPGTKGTLTLNGAQIATGNGDIAGIGIMVGDADHRFIDLTIKLVGDNQIGKTVAQFPEELEEGDMGGYTVANGIYAYGSVTFTGAGNLTIYSRDTGIFANSDQGEPSINFNTAPTGTVTINSYAHSDSDAAIKTGGSVTISGGTVNATSNGEDGAGINSWGDVTINGGTTTVTSVGQGIVAIKVSITDGEVSITSGKSGIASEAGVTITGGKVTATSTGEMYNAIYAQNVTISGDDTEVTANGAAIGIGGTSVAISGGKVDLTSSNGYGIYSGYNITISGKDTKVTVNAKCVGVYGGTNVDISGGTVNVASSNEDGILSSAVRITDGTVKAKGATAAIKGSNELVINTDKLEIKNANETYTTGKTKTLTCADDQPYVLIQPKQATPPSSGGDHTPTVTVPVAGDKDSVKVTATVKGSTATIKNVTSEQLDKVGTGKEVTIDLSSLNKSVIGVTFPKTTLENVAASEASGLEVKLPGGTTAVFDKATVAAIAEQAAGSDIQLVIDTTLKAAQVLTGAQKSAIKGMKSALVLEAYFTSNGKRISDFKGGEAELTVSYPTTKPVRVWYLTEEGALEAVPSSFDGKSASFVVKHFSNYVIEQLDETAMPFVDVAENTYYYDAVKWAAANGITQGADTTHFSPFVPVTRAQVVTFLWRASGCPEPTGNASKFTDVVIGSYYEKAVAWAIEQGITKGTSDTTFSPDKVCTRGQIVTFLARFAGVKDEDTGYTHGFVDVKATDYYNNAVAWAKDNKVTEGTSKTTFSPNVDCTRAQVVTFLYRWMVK